MKAEFHLDGMHCESCAELIKETLEDTAGVRHVDVTFSGKTAVVNFDENTVQQATLIKKIQSEFKGDFWGFWMLGGMSGGGMGFIFAPQAKARGQERLLEVMLETKLVKSCVY